MRWYAVLLVAAVMAVMVVTTSARQAEAHTVTSVEIIPQHSGKCMDVAGLRDLGAAIHQWTCLGLAWQRWTVIDKGGGWHQLKNVNTGYCLDVPYPGAHEGEALWQWNCNEGDAQKFLLTGGAGSWTQLRTKVGYPGTNLCVDVALAGEGDGTAVRLWGCNQTPAQTWQVGLAYAWGKAPFAGEWGFEFGTPGTDSDTRPWDHHLLECAPVVIGTYNDDLSVGYCTDNPDSSRGGNWSFDYYAPSNTQVKFSASGIGVAGSTVVGRVRGLAPTCDDDPGGLEAGRTVFIDIINSLTTEWYGWVSYGHLKDISVTHGQTIFVNQVLGKTENWGNVTGCYEVNNENGVHTHMEVWNRYRNACFMDWGSMGYPLGYGARLGDVGRANYANYRTPC